MSGLGGVGSLLSILTSSTPFQKCNENLQLVYEGRLSQAVLTLTTLLQEGMLYSTAHQLQAVSLLYFADPEGAVSSLTSLAAKETVEPVVRAMVTLLLQQEHDGSSSFSSISNITPAEYIKTFEKESGTAAVRLDQPMPAEMTTLESLGMKEFIEVEASLRSAARGPLLPKDERAAIDALKQQVQIDSLEQVAATVMPADVALAASNNPELASEVIATALQMHEYNAAVSRWAAVCLWKLAAPEAVSINVITCWAQLLDKIDVVEPSALAAFISHSIQYIISIDDKVTATRLARMLAHLLHRVIDKNNPAILIVAVEVEGLCTQFISQEVCSTLYAKLAALGE